MTGRARQRARELRALADLAALVAERRRAELMREERRHQPVRAELSRLETPAPAPDGATLAEAHDRAAWEVWRAGRRRDLAMALARAETTLRPLRHHAARAVARERVLDRLAKEGR
ncbi:hypothetical protein [Jannaschia sp. W003]|uniref:hypothetical protein n=1 Tax=Jannaschia sp. W003 TaxID=2867012 RepID=UPI0021A55026|nr:hypothetical protein [Jannaschia sp. W003]UWQ21830.1 hypothetical protein K3554_02020 [Jannaschia sp. W003]